VFVEAGQPTESNILSAVSSSTIAAQAGSTWARDKPAIRLLRATGGTVAFHCSLKRNSSPSLPSELPKRISGSPELAEREQLQLWVSVVNKARRMLHESCFTGGVINGVLLPFVLLVRSMRSDIAVNILKSDKLGACITN
jgi:hypothetical protein